METILIGLSVTLLALSLLLRHLRDGRVEGKVDGGLRQQLAEVAQEAQIAKRACLNSVEQLQQKFEQLQRRAPGAEPRGFSLTEPLRPERKENYEAAALLLAGGQSSERVASLLGLTVSQVEFVAQLQRIAIKEPTPSLALPARQIRKIARQRRHKTTASAKTPKRVRPILLTEVAKPENANGVAA